MKAEIERSAPLELANLTERGAAYCKAAQMEPWLAAIKIFPRAFAER